MPSARIPGKGGGIDGTEPELARKSRGGRRPIVGHRVTARRRKRRNAGAGESIRAHNTLSAEATHVHVLYPFHPLHGATLQLVRRPKRGDEAVTVLDSNGKRLKIPTWMLSVEAGDARIAEQACLSKHALQSLADLLAVSLPTEDNNHDNLLPRVAGPKGGQRGAVATSRDEDGHSSGSARRPKGPRRGNRSDGPHSGGRISNSGSKE